MQIQGKARSMRGGLIGVLAAAALSAAPCSAVQLSSIGDFVWLDANVNGIQDAGEAGVPSVTVTLTGTTTGGNAVSLTTSTDSTGHYHFFNLEAGTYALTVTLPLGFQFTLSQVGSDRNVDSDFSSLGQAGPFSLGFGVTDLSRDAGICQTSTFVFQKGIGNGTTCYVSDVREPGTAVLFLLALGLSILAPFGFDRYKSALGRTGRG